MTTLARNAVLPLDVVRDYFPAVTEQASTGPNETAIGNPVATRSVIYASADGMEKVTLSVDQYGSPGEAAAAFQQAVDTSRAVPGFQSLPAPGIGQQSFAGTVTMGQETHIGMGALDGSLVVGATLAGFDASPDNQARLATLSAQEDAAARAAVGLAPMTHDDAYIVPQDHVLTAPAADSVLFNDHNATTATLVSGPVHGSLLLAGDGSFSYTPAAGFAGIDSFAYRAGNGSGTADAQALLYVVPTQGAGAPTLDLLALTAEQQVAATYTAFFGRAADAGGFEFWVSQLDVGLPKQGPAALVANIASSFGTSNEALALYPILAHPVGASDAQIGSALDSAYDNLFNRSPDAAGLAYWTGRVHQALAQGKSVDSVLVDIISGAQVGPDAATLMGRVAVGLEFVHQQEAHHTAWNGASDQAAATALVHSVTSDPQTVLIGIQTADAYIGMHKDNPT